MEVEADAEGGKCTCKLVGQTRFSSKAAAIVAYRDENGPFDAIKDLANVPSSIGPAALDNLRPLLQALLSLPLQGASLRSRQPCPLSPLSLSHLYSFSFYAKIYFTKRIALKPTNE